MRKFLSVIFVLFPIISFGSIIMTPYLMAVGTNYIYVIVECTVRDTVTVNYGLTPTYGLSAKTEKIDTTDISPTTYVHKIKISGLSPNTFYYYQVVQGASTSSGSTFRTAVNFGTNFRFVWMADSRRPGHPYHDQICSLITTKNPLFLMHGGDVGFTSAYSDWKEDFFRVNQLNVINHIPFYFAVGNHEGWLQNTMAFTQDSRYSGTEGYYSFDYGFMHVLAINNEVNYDSGSAQYNFAYNDLASTTKPWKIVIYHKPAYCCGGEGENSHMQKFSRNIFVPLHVDMVFNGHSHFYQHNLVSGLHHMIIGSAGAELQTPHDTTYTVKSVMDYNFGVIDVTQNDFTVLVYDNLNVLIDSVRLHKSVGIENNTELIDGFRLYDNFPNPFNPTTNIKYQIANNKYVVLKIYNALGKEVETLVNEKQSQGTYEVKWDGSNYPSGIYFYKLQASEYIETKKMVLLK